MSRILRLNSRKKPSSKERFCLKCQVTGLIVSVCFFSAFAVKQAQAESVRFILASENKPESLFLFPGRASLLSLPCPITKALVGSSNDIKAEVDKINPQDVHILLRRWASQPSNLILKCSDRVFLFNLIPARKSHYDYVQVLSHIKPPFKLKVKFPLPNTPSTNSGGLRDGEDFTIRKVLDFSWKLNPKNSGEDK